MESSKKTVFCFSFDKIQGRLYCFIGKFGIRSTFVEENRCSFNQIAELRKNVL